MIIIAKCKLHDKVVIIGMGKIGDRIGIIDAITSFRYRVYLLEGGYEWVNHSEVRLWNGEIIEQSGEGGDDSDSDRFKSKLKWHGVVIEREGDE